MFERARTDRAERERDRLLKIVDNKFDLSIQHDLEQKALLRLERERQRRRADRKANQSEQQDPHLPKIIRDARRHGRARASKFKLTHYPLFDKVAISRVG